MLAEIKARREPAAHPGGGPHDLQGRAGHPPQLRAARELLHHQAGGPRPVHHGRQVDRGLLADHRDCCRGRSRERSSTSRCDVLLVEDNPGDARLHPRDAARRRRRHAVEVVARRSAGGGGARLAEGPLDAVLLDLSLPDGQGLDDIRACCRRSARPCRSSCSPGWTTRRWPCGRCRQGAQDYLVKGQVDGHLLVRALRYAIERKRGARSAPGCSRASETARAEAERLAAERAAILGQIADGVIIADPSGSITFVNEAARRLRGLARFPARRPGRRPLPAPDHGRSPVSARRAAPGPRGAARRDGARRRAARFAEPDGTEIIVQGSATPVLAEDGSRLGRGADCCATSPPSASWSARRTSSSPTSRTTCARRWRPSKPRSASCWPTSRAGMPEPLHRMFVNIDLAADRMAKLVDDLLELARLQAGRVQLAPGPLRPARAGAAQAAARSSRWRRVAASASRSTLPPAPLVTRADAARLERALLNLLGNAHKYGRDGGVDPADAGARATARRCTRWRTTARASPQRIRTRIFERFYRSEQGGDVAHEPGQRPGPADRAGAGRAARRSHLGRERARARARRSGSRCRWRPAAAVADGERCSMKILVVDDDPQILDALTVGSSSSGRTARSSPPRDGEQGLRRLLRARSRTWSCST